MFDHFGPNITDKP